MVSYSNVVELPNALTYTNRNCNAWHELKLYCQLSVRIHVSFFVTRLPDISKFLLILGKIWDASKHFLVRHMIWHNGKKKDLFIQQHLLYLPSLTQSYIVLTSKYVRVVFHCFVCWELDVRFESLLKYLLILSWCQLDNLTFSKSVKKHNWNIM